MKIADSYIILRRMAFYRDATLGRLLTDEGELICYTLEPTWREDNQRKVRGKTAVPEGVYILSEVFDSELRYKCLRVCGVNGMRNVHLCFITQQRATPDQTRGNILLGTGLDYVNGSLTDCIGAFRRLYAYYASKRCNHQRLCLHVINEGAIDCTDESFHVDSAGVNSTELEDYEINTY